MTPLVICLIIAGQTQSIVMHRANIYTLARIIQGESTGDTEAAYYVGWVAKNRRQSSLWPNTYKQVTRGFNGYRRVKRPNTKFRAIAKKIVCSTNDPTLGSFFALSRTDITDLGVEPAQAQVTKSEWFFFAKWPLSRGDR